MATLAVLTASYRQDFPGFARLHASLCEFADRDVTHHVVVPHRDLGLFRGINSDRLVVWDECEVLPPGIVSTGWLAGAARRAGLPSWARVAALNVRRPWLPVRGWVLQQILKLALAPRIGVDALLVIDSDVVLVRPMPTALFATENAVRLYCNPAGIRAEGMPRHQEWTAAAHRLLGLPTPKAGPQPDYVGGIVVWEPSAVGQCLRRIEEATQRSWSAAFAEGLHVSEFVLYGTYVEHWREPRTSSWRCSTTLCHSRWDPTPMTEAEAVEFGSALGHDDVAVHVQSNSGTPAVAVRSAIRAARATATRSADSEALAKGGGEP